MSVVEVHPAADEFPMMDDETFAAFMQSIAEDGQEEPIWLAPDGRLLDGRNRLKACRQLGIEPRFETFESSDDDELRRFIDRKNEHRRHLSDTFLRDRRRKRVAEKRAAGMSTTRIAEQEGVSRSQVDRDLHLSRSGKDADSDDPAPERIVDVNGVSRPAERHTYSEEEAVELVERYNGATPDERAGIADELGIKVSSLYRRIGELRSKYGLPGDRTGTRADTKAKVEAVRDLAAKGYSSAQIADELGYGRAWIKRLAESHGVEVHADAIVANRQRIDHNRVIDETVRGAHVDAATLELVDYTQLDRDRLEEWVSSLKASIRSLNIIRRQLEGEMTP